MLERAIEIAVEAHKGQKDKVGVPYIMHPLRLMMRMEDEEARLVAILHDVAEDGPGWSLQRLRDEGFSNAVMAALDCVTRRDDESYEQFIERAAPNPLARRVKLADLEDNMNMLRFRRPEERDWLRLKRYHKSWNRLKSIKD